MSPEQRLLDIVNVRSAIGTTDSAAFGGLLCSVGSARHVFIARFFHTLALLKSVAVYTEGYSSRPLVDARAASEVRAQLRLRSTTGNPHIRCPVQKLLNEGVLKAGSERAHSAFTSVMTLLP